MRRESDPRDGRARLVVMTDRGWAATRAATDAGAAAARPWLTRLGPARTAALLETLREAGGAGRLRPVW